jgi:hypothetical protein
MYRITVFVAKERYVDTFAMESSVTFNTCNSILGAIFVDATYQCRAAKSYVQVTRTRSDG